MSSSNHEKKSKVAASSGVPFYKRGWAIALGVLVLLVIGGAVIYPLIPVPQVQGYFLKDTVHKISYNAPIKIVFNQLMDQNSVQQAFQISPAVQGSFQWQGNTLLFQPQAQFKVGNAFKVSVGSSARSIFEKPLQYGYEENFQIVAAPQVLLFSPADSSVDVPVDAQLTVHFDRPMIPLTTLAQASEKDINMKIDPSVSGKARWLGTSTMTFIPDQLAYATHYTVTIPQGTSSAEGGTTDKDFAFSFDTVKPVFVSSVPADLNPYNGNDTVVKLTFNQPMNLQTAPQDVLLYKYTGDKSFVQKISWSSNIFPNNPSQPNQQLLTTTDLLSQFNPSQWQAVPVQFSYYTADQYKADYLKGQPQDAASQTQEVTIPDESELQKTLVMSPSQPLDEDSVYLVKMSKDFGGAQGTFTLGQDYGVTLKTTGDLGVVSTTPTDNAQNFSDQTVSVMFNQHMDATSFDGHVQISPKSYDSNNQEQKPSVSLDSDVNMSIQYPFQPSTNYTVTIQQGIQSVSGKMLGKDIVLHFTTAALAPTFSLVSSPDISVLDGTKPKVYYVKSTNVDSLHFQFKQLSNAEFQKMYGDGYVNNYVPTSGFQSYDVSVKKDFNKRVTTRVDLEQLTGQTLASGYYYFEVTSPGVNDDSGNPLTSQQLFVVTNYALATKLSNTQLLVWATSMKEGAPVAGMGIQAVNSQDGSVLTGTTDSDGLAMINIPPKNDGSSPGDYLVTGTLGSDLTVTHTTWADGVAAWDFNIDYSPDTEKYFVYEYTDRPIYRPGDTVYFKGLVRINNDLSYSLPDRKTANITIQDSNGQQVSHQTVNINQNGTFNGQFILSDQAATGDYQMTASLALSSEPQYSHEFYQSFKVAAYRKPDYQMTVTPDKDSYVNGDTANILVNGQYFFGAPLPNAPLDYTIQSDDYYFFIPEGSTSPYASDPYSFSDDGNVCSTGNCQGNSAVVAQGKGALDANGNYTIQQPLDIKNNKLSQFYTVEATAYDVNKQSVSNRATFVVQQGEYYVGIMNKDYVATQGSPTTFDVITVDKDGNPVAGKSVQVTLFERQWNTIGKQNVDGSFYNENNYQDIQKDQKTVVTDNSGHTTVSFVPTDGGDYRITAESYDSKGNKISAGTETYVTSNSFVNWGQENNDRIELVPDKQEYKVGDTAHVLIKSPYQNVYALVTYERQKIVYEKVIRITSNSQIIDVPITQDALPNEFVSVVIVKGNNTAAGLQDPGKQIDERDVSAFKMGYTTLQVDTSSRKLAIAVTSDKPKYHPGDMVSLNVKTADAAGIPVAADVSISVVDESVLSLTDNVTADLLSAFYRQRYLGVETAETLAKALSRLNVQVESGLKGGGGGAIAKRGTFKDTAFWQAEVNTDSKGNGTVQFKLPDNLTTWQVLAIGITKDTLVGSQKMDFLVTKDVIATPNLPRFMIVNDTMTLSTTVHNYLDKAADFTVDLKGTGVQIDSNQTQTIHLDPGQEQVVNFPVEVLDQPQADLTFEAIETDDNTVGDIVETKVPINSFSFPEVVAASDTITDNTVSNETVWLPNGIDPKFGQLTISVASTLAGTLSQGLQYLVQYPYGCSEQIASSLLPNLAVKELSKLPGLGVDKVVDVKQLQTNVQTGLQALYQFQQSDGGWGIWQNSQSTPYLSSYVLYSLYEAQKEGYSVDSGVYQRGIAYVKGVMQNLPVAANVQQQPDARSNANNRAFALFVLAEMQQGDLGLSNNLYDHKDLLNNFAKAYLVMTYKDLIGQLSLTGATKADATAKMSTLENEIIAVAKETPRGVHFEETNPEFTMMDTNDRTTALVLQMLSRVDSNNVLIPKILRYMLLEKQDGHFASTQETAVSLLALAEYLKSSNELQPNFQGVVTVNNVPQIQHSFTQNNLADVQTVSIPLTDLLPNNQDNEISASKSGPGKMYFDMNLKYSLPTDQIQADDEGIFVSQNYYEMNDTKLQNPVSTVKMGDNLIGQMTVIVPEDRYYVMAEDYLPAGLEGVDFSLNTAQQSLQNQMNASGNGTGQKCDHWSCWDESWRFEHNEVRDDRMMFFADYLPKGVYTLKYVVRATTAGTFHKLPALVQETYFPEVFGRSAGSMFTILP